MKLRLLMACAVLSSALGVLADEPTCQFFSAPGQQTNYFRLELPREYSSTTKTRTLVRLTALSPGVFLVYPREIHPYQADSYFAGKYQDSGNFRFRVEAIYYGRDEVRPKTEEFTISFPPGGEPLTGAALCDFLTAQVRECERLLEREPRNAFYQYVRLQASKRANIDVAAPELPMGRWRRIIDRDVDMFSITSGALAIQESLQLEEMTEPVPPVTDLKPTVDLSTLSGPTIRSHPFEKMLEGRLPRFSQAAKLVPRDFYYAHFWTLEDLLELLDLAQTWGGHFLRTYAVSGRSDRLADKFRQQLLLKLDPVSRPLLGNAIRDVTITGSDPFFLTGCDLTVLFRMTGRPVLEAYRTARVAEARRTHPDLKLETFQYQKISVSSASLPSGEIHSCFALLDDWAIFSNSRTALLRVLDVAKGKAPSLADAPDFRYMRTIFPAPGEPARAAAQRGETGFLYLSDPHIRYLVGPELKIKGQRRSRCINHLRIIEHAALLFRIENQRKSKSLKELIERNYVDPRLLQCPDGGEYSLEPKSFMAACTVHNRLRYVTPIVEIPLEKVTGREAQEYRNYVSRYNSYWRTYFDPIGIRINTNQTISFETCILPLIENSFYNNLRASCGGEAVNLAGFLLAPGTALSAGARINMKPYLDRAAALRMLDQRVGGNAADVIHRAIGPTYAFALLDAEPLISFDLNRYLGEVLRWRMETSLIWMPMLAGINLPAYVAIEVKDQKALAGFLAGLEAFLAQKSVEERPGRFSLRCDFYQLPDYRGHRFAAVGMEFITFKARLFYCIVGNFLYVANREHILRQLVDLAAGQERHPVLPGNVYFSFHCGNWKQLLEHLELRWEEKSRKACFGNFVPLGVLFQAKDPDASIEEFCWQSHGRIYTCPDRGKYDFVKGEVLCSVHGAVNAPRQTPAPPPENRFARLLKELNAIELSLRFTPEGLMTYLQLRRP